MQTTAHITHFTRFHGYDYGRGAAMFITFGIEPRQPILGSVVGDHVVLSPVGEIVLAELHKAATGSAGIQLRSFVIMPDHVHLRVQIVPGLAAPLKALGRFVYNVKCRSQRRAGRLGVAFSWQTNYHDRICCSRDIIDLVDKYIANNPIKWTLMHGNPPPLRVHEPLDAPRLPPDEWWTGVGNTELLAHTAKLAAVRLSRSLCPGDFPGVVARLRDAAAKGYVLAGTWISPCEQVVFADVAAHGYPLVRTVQDPLAMVYRPTRDEPGLFAAGRYLLLSRVCAGTGRGAAWHGINDALADMARTGDGTSVYVHRVPGEAAPRWEF